MQTDRVRAAAAPLVLALVCGLAAAAPQALDHVPEDAAIVVAIRNVGDLLGDVDRANVMMGEQADPQVGMVTSMLRGLPGLNLEGSAAAVITAPGGQADPESMVVILPVTDFAAFTQGGDVTDGVTAITLGPGPAFAKPLGDGFAAIGQHDSVVRGFAGDAGRMGAHNQRLGASGRAVADGADLTVVVDIAPFREQMLQGLQMMEQQAMMFAAMSGAGAEAGAPVTATVQALRGYITDAGTAVVGATSDEAGFAFDAGVQFSEGSASAKAFDARGETAALLGRVPAMPYYAAYAVDVSGGGAAQLFGQFGAAQQGQMPGQVKFADLMEHADGVAGVFGSSPALMSAGLFSRYVTYTRSDEPQALLDLWTTSLQGANGQEVQGMSLTSTYEKGAQTIAGVPVDAYTMKMTMPQGAGGQMGMMNPQMMLSMMFGPSQGPSGYLARLDSGIVQTMSRDTALAEKAITAAREGDGLGADARVKSVAARLPEGRFFEAFISADQVYNAAGPMLMMFGAAENVQPVGPMDPIGMGASGVGGGLHWRMFLPAEAVAKAMELAPKPQPVFQDDGWDEQEEGDDDIEF